MSISDAASRYYEYIDIGSDEFIFDDGFVWDVLGWETVDGVVFFPLVVIKDNFEEAGGTGSPEEGFCLKYGDFDCFVVFRYVCVGFVHYDCIIYKGVLLKSNCIKNGYFKDFYWLFLFCAIIKMLTMCIFW